MPVWGQIILGAAAVVGALGVLWSKVLHPGARLVTSTELMLPLLRELTEVFRDNPTAFHVLDEIASQFRTDSGSSLRDVVNRLEAAALENKRASEILKVGVEASKLLAEQDRAQLARLIILLDRLTIRVDAGAAAVDKSVASGERIEAGQARVASELIAAQQAVDTVAANLALAEQDRARVAADLLAAQGAVDAIAADLAAAHHRADAQRNTPPGTAADAASQSDLSSIPPQPPVGNGNPV